MRKKQLIGVGLAAALVLVGQSCLKTAVEPSLTLSQTSYDAGDAISVTYEVPEGYDTSAWVGVIPSSTEHGSESVNDQFDVQYKYLEGSTSGTLSFTAPDEGGSWDLRLNTSDTDGTEVASTTFSVTAPVVAEVEDDVEPTLETDATSYESGDEISVDYTAPASFDTTAWVGLIPSDVAHGDEDVNDANDVAYEYLSGATSGTLTFTAPEEAGEWDLRMNESDAGGEEVATVSFTVE